MKRNITNDKPFLDFIKLLDQELKSRLAKISNERRMIEMFDNASIHKKKEVKFLVNKLG